MYSVVRPILFRFPAETAHTLGMMAARVAQGPARRAVASVYGFEDETLRQVIWDREFVNPIGLAAGFDKNATLLPFWETIGFGFAEIGSVTAEASRGNPRPRAFRLEADRAIINRMGLNSHGAERVRRRLDKVSPRLTRPFGINIAKTNETAITEQWAIDDYVATFRKLAPFAAYVALNVSCPNTSDGTTFEDPESLDRLLHAIIRARNDLQLGVPVLIKLSPPISERVIFDSMIEEIVAVSLNHQVSGFVAVNTTNDRSSLETSQAELDRIGGGGLSGMPLRDRSTRLVAYLYDKVGSQVPIIGVGGISSAESAYEKICAGASLVELYTGLVYEGPGLVRRLKSGLVDLLHRDGHASIRDAVGTSVAAQLVGR